MACWLTLSEIAHNEDTAGIVQSVRPHAVRPTRMPQGQDARSGGGSYSVIAAGDGRALSEIFLCSTTPLEDLSGNWVERDSEKSGAWRASNKGGDQEQVGGKSEEFTRHARDCTPSNARKAVGEPEPGNQARRPNSSACNRQGSVAADIVELEHPPGYLGRHVLEEGT